MDFPGKANHIKIGEYIESKLENVSQFFKFQSVLHPRHYELLMTKIKFGAAKSS